MRKLFTIVALGAMTLGASAQGFEGNKFFDNWYFGIEGGATTSFKGQAVFNNEPVKVGAVADKRFIPGARPVAGFELGKQIVPAFALAVQGRAGFNYTGAKTVVDYADAVVLGKVNLSNFFLGYKGIPRFFELEGAYGFGLRNYFGTENDHLLKVISKAGLNLLFNLGQSKAWTIAVKPAVIWDVDGKAIDGDFSNGGRYNLNAAQFEVTAGLTYHFKGSNGKHHLTIVTPRDQAEIDGLNAKINGLRGQLGDKDAQLAAANRTIADLQNQLNDCRNQKPVVIKEETPAPAAKALESVVTFRQGKTVIDPAQQPNVERIASYLKKHADATVVIKGYASPEGSLALNKKLAENRAQAVKNLLVNKYKIAASRISAEGQGVGDLFEEADWNRVAISTIADK